MESRTSSVLRHAPMDLVIIVLLLLTACPLSAKRNDDVIIMKNGDKFTGEIKGLEYGELIFKAAYMKDPVHLNWKEVDGMKSQDAFIVSLINGTRLTGFINLDNVPNDNDRRVTISAAGTAVVVKSTDVVAIGQREGRLWDQLTGSIDYGFNFASGNNSTNSSLSAQVAFRSNVNAVQVAASSQFSSQTHATNTNRFTFDSQYARTLNRQWIAAGLFSLLKSNQQNVELRSTYGAGIGRKLVQTERTFLTAIGGAAYSHESYVPQPGAEPIRNNAEMLFGLAFSAFRFKTQNVNSQLLLFPSLSDPGRFRLSSQSNFRIELVRNFYFNLQLYENYDTRPPVSAPRNDLGVTTSIGWTF